MGSKLDETKPYGTAFIGNKSYIGQDGRYFDPNTREEVIPPTPVQTGFACKICGALRPTPEQLKEHLLAMHTEKVPELRSQPAVTQPVVPDSLQDDVPETGEKKEETEPSGEPESSNEEKVEADSGLGTMTVPELKNLAKGAGIKGYNNMDKPALIDALHQLPKTAVE